MNGPLDLAAMGAGFAAPALASQQVFRGALEALSRPGRIVRVASDAQPPACLHPAAAALALSLLDQDTRLWISGIGAGSAEAAAFLRFHTGCAMTGEPAEADFALVAAERLPPLETFPCGTNQHPERSATLIVQVAALSDEDGWTLTGPGIRDEARLRVGGLAPNFPAQWARNGQRFPCGIDLFLACGERLCGLPRTVRIGA